MLNLLGNITVTNPLKQNINVKLQSDIIQQVLCFNVLATYVASSLFLFTYAIDIFSNKEFGKLPNTVKTLKKLYFYGVFKLTKGKTGNKTLKQKCFTKSSQEM